MASDMCLEVDEHDRILGSVSKREAHSVTEQSPRARLHRAFSVFLFDEANRLLLQQRAGSKITFPNVWTNTCCSHPLFCPEEMDTEEKVRSGEVPGIKRASIRKLQDELGIDPSSLTTQQFKYLTRVIYFARDETTYGTESCPWAEHEVDYILFVRASVKLDPNPEEVQQVRYVSREELEEMMRPSSGLLWSPWFHALAQSHLPQWWEDLNDTLLSDKFVDTQRIYRLGDVQSI